MTVSNCEQNCGELRRDTFSVDKTHPIEQEPKRRLTWETGRHRQQQQLSIWQVGVLKKVKLKDGVKEVRGRKNTHFAHPLSLALREWLSDKDHKRTWKIYTFKKRTLRNVLHPAFLHQVRCIVSIGLGKYVPLEMNRWIVPLRTRKSLRIVIKVIYSTVTVNSRWLWTGSRKKSLQMGKNSYIIKVTNIWVILNKFCKCLNTKHLK